MTKLSIRIRKLVLALALAAGAAGAVAGPALAADWHHGRPDWHGREWHRPVGAPLVAPVYAPAPVYAYPPAYPYPAVVAPPVVSVGIPPVASLNFVLPLTIQ